MIYSILDYKSSSRHETQAQALSILSVFKYSFTVKVYSSSKEKKNTDLITSVLSTE